MNLKPVGTQILVQLDKQEDSMQGGIYIPTSANDNKPTLGTVLALGSGFDKGKTIPFNVKVGDRVLFPRYVDGVLLKHEGETYCVVREEAILGIVENLE